MIPRLMGQVEVARLMIHLSDSELRERITLKFKVEDVIKLQIFNILRFNLFLEINQPLGVEFYYNNHSFYETRRL